MEEVLYHYNATVTDVYDGDTCTVDIDLGLHTWLKGEKIRLYRINAPELKGKEREKGLLSRDFLRGLILNKKVIIQTVKDKKGKYGRYLGEIWYLKNGNKYSNINDLLVKKRFAVYHDY
jgi:endonuclease YncB( thermonuclease family)